MASVNLIQPRVRKGTSVMGIVGNLEEATIYCSKDGLYEWDDITLEADTIGPYIGKGIGGMVFRLKDEDDQPINKVLKIVKLLPNDMTFVEYAERQPLGLHQKAWQSLVGSKVLAMNQFQADLFTTLAAINKGIYPQSSKTPKVPKALPIVYSCAQGEMNEAFREKVFEAERNHPFDKRSFKLFQDNFPVGTHIAYWIMEYIPCTNESSPPFCGFAPSAENRPQTSAELAADPRFRKEQKGYQDVSKFLYDMGWVVRDTINPGNFGYREDGSVVFFDLFVIPWPPSRMDGELRQMAHSLIGKQDIIDYRNSIKNGHYFNRRTQSGGYSAENSR